MLKRYKVEDDRDTDIKPNGKGKERAARVEDDDETGEGLGRGDAGK